MQKPFFFSIYFQFLFLTSFHLVGSKSWESFTLLSMKVPIQISQIFFWRGGGIAQEQEPSWALDSEEPNYRYPLVISIAFWQKSGQPISCTLIWLFGGVVCPFLMDLIPKWRPINYSFVCMLFSPLSLIFTSKFFCFLYMLTRRRGLINMQTKE